MGWADRVAYVCHDFEDAVAAGIVTDRSLPAEVAAVCGTSRREQLSVFVAGLVSGIVTSGHVAMPAEIAHALAAFRRFNYEHIYLRPASRQQALLVVDLLQALVEHMADRPHLLPEHFQPDDDAGTPGAYRAAVSYVGGMTDRFACRTAVALLGWETTRLPVSVV